MHCLHWCGALCCRGIMGRMCCLAAATLCVAADDACGVAARPACGCSVSCFGYTVGDNRCAFHFLRVLPGCTESGVAGAPGDGAARAAWPAAAEAGGPFSSRSRVKLVSGAHPAVQVQMLHDCVAPPPRVPPNRSVVYLKPGCRQHTILPSVPASPA